jgi:MFS family permease
MITSTFLLASWFGCMIITFFGIKFGRKTWILVGNTVEIIGTIISASSYSYGQLSKYPFQWQYWPVINGHS